MDLYDWLDTAAKNEITEIRWYEVPFLFLLIAIWILGYVGIAITGRHQERKSKSYGIPSHTGRREDDR